MLIACGLAALATSAGCTSDILIILKEYQPAQLQGKFPGLTGKKICLNEFRDAPPANYPTFIEYLERIYKVTEPAPGFVFSRMTEEDRNQWNTDRKAMKTKPGKEKLLEMGWCDIEQGWFPDLELNIAVVSSFTSPARWIKESLELELKEQGAHVVSRDDDADLVISCKIKYIRFGTRNVSGWRSPRANLVVEFSLAPKGGKSQKSLLHLRARRSVNISNDYTFYVPFRICLQKLCWIVLPKIEQMLE